MGMRSFIVALALGLATASGCSRPSIGNVVVTEDDHLKRIVVKKDASLVVLRLKAVHDQQLDLKSCEDYDVMHVQRTTISSGGRFPTYVPALEVYLKPKQNCDLQFKYKGSGGEERFFFGRVELAD